MREDICGVWCANLLVEDHLVLRIRVSQEVAEKSRWFCVLGAGHLTMVPPPRDHGRAPCTTRLNRVGDGREVAQTRGHEDDEGHLAETRGPPERCGLQFGNCGAWIILHRASEAL